MGYGATFGILGGIAPLPPPKSAYAVCVSSIFIQIAASRTVFLLFSWNLAQVVYVPICKKPMNRSFEILILKFWVNFLNFKIGLSLCNSSSEDIYTVSKKRPPFYFWNNSSHWSTVNLPTSPEKCHRTT